jgi:hypothetical protein
MSKYPYDLDSIIRNSFNETIKYLGDNGINNRKPILRITNSPYLNEHTLISLATVTILYYNEISNMIEHHTNYIPISPLIWTAMLFWSLWRFNISYGIYVPIMKTIYIIKSPLKRDIDKILDNLNSKNINGPSIIRIKSSEHDVVIYPIYTDGNNVEYAVTKSIIDIVVSHEIAHSLVGISELKASTLEYILYFYKNKLYAYPKIYEIIEENVKRCKKYVEETRKFDPYDLGKCYANIIINENKQSPNINIKNIIRKIKHLSKKDIINTIKNYNINQNLKI